ncbi:MAG TPA: ferritin-like fold-containing protein [Microbacterium sp.]|uniref:ferritin-like fold-containing protein n=1 Tax=Microbacterium sp. TaxID=51671 RepID=UPI002B4694DB|nr:ferritin-like fold-containing protein [Microbacterium sp.]HKT56755.1 ferritin-like fold-containing protein [Microbacterium sp.]
MFEWLTRRAPAARTLRLRSRDEVGDAVRVAFETLAPDVGTYLGQAAYLQLGYFETLSQLITETPSLGDKEALSRAAGAALGKHQALVALIRDRGEDPTELMRPFREPLDAFRRATRGIRPEETMLTVHLTAGLLDDFYNRLAVSYGEPGRRVARILQADDDREALVAILLARMAADPQWRSLLALWGRRLVGDTLLVARDVLRLQSADADDEKRVEPMFTDLMASHSRRMEALGLAA